MTKIKVLDLFAGGGGFSLGFKTHTENGRCPYEIVAAIEIDQYAVNTLVNTLVNQGLSLSEAERRVILGDITSNETKVRLYGVCREVDVIIGGPPCQSFSLIGPRSGDESRKQRFSCDDRDNLFVHYMQIVEHYKPRFFVFENVTGLLSKTDSNGFKIINKILNSMESLGYNLTSANKDISDKYIVLNAADYGVPQVRNRIFIIGNNYSPSMPNPFPQPTHCCCEDKNLLPWVTVKDAIGDLPFIKSKLTYMSRERNKRVTDPDEINRIDQLNSNRDNGADSMPFHWSGFNNHYNKGRKSRKLFLNYVKPNDRNVRLTGHISRSHQESDTEIFKLLNPGESSEDARRNGREEIIERVKYKMDSFRDKYKKLSWNEPSGTLFAHLRKDGNRFIHPDGNQERTITVREAARLQSFPDDYEVLAPGNVRYTYIGNAVPPLLSRAIAKAIHEAIKENGY